MLKNTQFWKLQEVASQININIKCAIAESIKCNKSELDWSWVIASFKLHYSLIRRPLFVLPGWQRMRKLKLKCDIFRNKSCSWNHKRLWAGLSAYLDTFHRKYFYQHISWYNYLPKQSHGIVTNYFEHIFLGTPACYNHFLTVIIHAVSNKQNREMEPGV